MRLSPNRRWLIAGLVLCWSVAGTVPGQDDEFEELDALRERFEKDLKGSERPVFEAFVKELRQLESEAAVREDYEAALRAKERRQQVLEMLGAPGTPIVKWRDDAAVELDLSIARRSSGLHWNVKDGVLGRWKSRGMEAEWELRGLGPQVYEVEITYSCGRTQPPTSGSNQDRPRPVQAGGEFQFGEKTGLVEASSKPIRYEVKPTKDWDDYRAQLIGSLEIKGRIARLQLTSVSVTGEDLMQVKRIRLIPTIPKGGRPTVRELAALESGFRQAVAERGTQVRDAYLKDLEEMERSARAANNQNLVERIAAERKSVLEQPLEPAHPAQRDGSAKNEGSLDPDAAENDG